MSLRKRFLKSPFAKSPQPAQTETPLWEHLDSCGIGFRSSIRQLIAEHEHHPLGWAPERDICTIASPTPFVAGLDQDVSFEFDPESDLSGPPELLRCATRANPDFRINYAKATHNLVQIFGDGEPNSTQNSVGRIWTFGQAWMTCTTYPPDRQDQTERNPRHDMFPDRATEAAIHIFPAYHA